MTIEITDLRHCPEFLDIIADRVWQAWWRQQGVELSYIGMRLQEALAGEQAVPTVLVAHQGSIFAGTAALIADDLDVRRQYTPWVAAVWVELAFRSQKIGARLVAAAAEAAFAAGYSSVYLCAREKRASYYAQLGWTPIEERVGPLKLTVFRSDRHNGLT